VRVSVWVDRDDMSRASRFGSRSIFGRFFGVSAGNAGPEIRKPPRDRAASGRATCVRFLNRRVVPAVPKSVDRNGAHFAHGPHSIPTTERCPVIDIALLESGRGACDPRHSGSRRCGFRSACRTEARDDTTILIAIPGDSDEPVRSQQGADPRAL
jgi:hypothetical protein